MPFLQTCIFQIPSALEILCQVNPLLKFDLILSSLDDSFLTYILCVLLLVHSYPKDVIFKVSNCYSTEVPTLEVLYSNLCPCSSTRLLKCYLFSLPPPS